MKKVWEYIPTIVCKCSLRWFLNFALMKDKVENVRSSSTDPRTCTIILFVDLKNSENECFKMREAFNVCQSCIKGLTWNGVAILATTLDFMVILNMLDYISKTFTNKMVEQIFDTSRDAFASKILIGFKCRSLPQCDLINSICQFKFSSTSPCGQYWIINLHSIHEMRCWKSSS